MDITAVKFLEYFKKEYCLQVSEYFTRYLVYLHILIQVKSTNKID